MLLAVGVIGISESDFRFAVQKSFYDLQTLHERMILITDLVLPRAEPAARINTVGLESRHYFAERFVSV